MSRTPSHRDELASRAFGSLFLLERRWTRLADRALADAQITMKQWLLLAAVVKLFPEPPSIKELAHALNTSHQNVKGIATRLEQRGLLRMTHDAADRRVWRVEVTEANTLLWEERGDRDLAFIGSLFEGLEDDELGALARFMGKLARRAEDLDKNAN